MKRFIVGMDASEGGGVALRWAANLAAAAGAELVAVHAFRSPYAEVTPGEYHRLVTECRELLDGSWTDPARRRGATVRSLVVDGDPGTVLLDAAEAEHADLVVVGRSGAGASPGLLHIGSIAESLAHHTTRPLAVIPTDATGPTAHVVVGADGSPESLHAALWAGRLGEDIHASVVGIVTHEEPSTRSGTHTLAEEWSEPLAEAGVSIQTLVRDDENAVDAFLDVANEMDADALVVGARPTGGVTGARIGGFAIKMLHRAELPVILVPPEHHDPSSESRVHGTVRVAVPS